MRVHICQACLLPREIPHMRHEDPLPRVRCQIGPTPFALALDRLVFLGWSPLHGGSWEELIEPAWASGCELS